MLTLMYHNILNESANGIPAASQQVPLSMFRQNIRSIKNQLLDPLKVHEQMKRGSVPRGVLVTFDDGGAGVLHAAHILADVGAKGVVFICPGALGCGLWFYRLANLLLKTPETTLRWRDFELCLMGPQAKMDAYGWLSKVLFDLSPSQRDQSLTEIADSARVPSGTPHPALTTLDEEGLHRAAETGGVVFANHSWSHPNLTKLSNDDLTYEVEAAQIWLEDSGLPFLPWFACPRGSYDMRVREVVSRFCTAQFGANAVEPVAGVISRTGIYRIDANPVRFAFKTALGGSAHMAVKSILA